MDSVRLPSLINEIDEMLHCGKSNKQLELPAIEDGLKKLEKMMLRMKEDVEKIQNEHNKLTATEEFLQKTKEQSLKTHNQYFADDHTLEKESHSLPVQRKARHEEVKRLLVDIHKKRKNLQLLNLHIREAVCVRESQALQETSSNIYDLVSKTDRSTTDPQTQLHCWYTEMKKVRNKPTNTTGNLLLQNKLFYNIKYKRRTQSSPAPEPEESLSFSTCCDGRCINVSISTDSNRNFGFVLSSDICIENFQASGEEYLRTGKTPEEFVSDVVWSWLKT